MNRDHSVIFEIASKYCRCYSVQFSSVQLLSHVWLFATPWIAAHQASLSITNSQTLLKLIPMEWVMPSSHLILCRPLLLLPPIPPSIKVFSNESTLHMRWPKYWSFSFNISPSDADVIRPSYFYQSESIVDFVVIFSVSSEIQLLLICLLIILSFSFENCLNMYSFY